MQNKAIKMLIRNNYFVNADMVQFLLTENLALKSLLHDKGILTPEEFSEHKKKASEILAGTVNSQLTLLEENPQFKTSVEEMLNLLKEDRHPVDDESSS
jgi:hypothetical protein